MPHHKKKFQQQIVSHTSLTQIHRTCINFLKTYKKKFQRRFGHTTKPRHHTKKKTFLSSKTSNQFLKKFAAGAKTKISRYQNSSFFKMRRYVILLAFSLLTCSNSWSWITWSPIKEDVRSYWYVDFSNADLNVSIELF